MRTLFVRHKIQILYLRFFFFLFLEERAPWRPDGWRGRGRRRGGGGGRKRNGQAGGVFVLFCMYAFGYMRRVFGGRQARVCRIWEGREIFMMGASPGASSGWNGNGTGIDMLKGEVADRKSRRDTARCLSHGGGIYDTL